MKELLAATALEQARLIARREIRVEELLDLYVAQIDEHDPALSAFVQRFDRRARRHARTLDERRDRWPDQLPTFFGVPFAMKDQDPMRWTFTRLGSRAYRHAFTPFDSPTTKCFRDAGFVILGKTSTSEFALLPIVEPDIHPPTRNPHVSTRSAGGSSGGAAAAVAAQMLPIAHGADGGGSIRIPASFCGLYGFKASRGVMPHFYGPLESVGLSVAGALARDVDDAAAALDVLCGDAIQSPGSWLDRSRAAPRSGLRVSFGTQSSFSSVVPEVAAEVRRVAALLESMGHEVEEGGSIDASIDEFVPVYGRLAANVPVLRESSVQPVTRWLRSIGRNYSNQDARDINAALSLRVDDWWGDADIWVLPTVGLRPPDIGAYAALDPGDHFRESAQLGAFTAPFNITGQPAASLPTRIGDDGLPIGVQIVARRGEDELVLRLSRALAEAEVWRSVPAAR